MSQGRHPAYPLLLIVPQRRQQLGGTAHLLLPLLLKVLPGGIPLGGDDGEQAGQRIGQLVVDTLLVVQHGAEHGETFNQLVAQHQAGLFVELHRALARGQLSQDEAKIEDLMLVQRELSFHLEPVLTPLDTQAQGLFIEALEAGAVLVPMYHHTGVNQLWQCVDQGECLLAVQLPLVAGQADGQLVAKALGLVLLGSQIPLPVVILPDTLAHNGLPLAQRQGRQVPLPGHQLDHELPLLPVEQDGGNAGPGGQLGIAPEARHLAVPGEIGDGIQRALQLLEPGRRQCRNGLQGR